jgi:hypothetical protein
VFSGSKRPVDSNTGKIKNMDETESREAEISLEISAINRSTPALALNGGIAYIGSTSQSKPYPII